MKQAIEVKNKKLILDFSYMQNVIFKDDIKHLDEIAAKLNILNVQSYSELLSFLRESRVEKGFICLINSNTRNGKKNSETFMDAVLRIQLNTSSQNRLEDGTFLGCYLDINLENPTLKIKNLFMTEMEPKPQSFDTEFGACPIEIIRFDKQMKPEQAIRECVINPYNAKNIKILSNKFEMQREKWANYLSYLGWSLKLRQSASELYLNLGEKALVRFEKKEIHNKDMITKAEINFSDSQYIYFESEILKSFKDYDTGVVCNVVFVDLLCDSLIDNHENLKKQSELFITPLISNKNLETIYTNKSGLTDFSYSKKTDINIFKSLKKWIGDSASIDISVFLMKEKTKLVKYFRKNELKEWIKNNSNLKIKRCFFEVDHSLSESDLKKLSTGYVSYIGAGENALLDRMREVLKKISLGQSKNPYLINYLFNTDLITFTSKNQFYDTSIPYVNNLNDEQKLAVTRALNTKDIFILQGPPGTGKTQVISEIIAQFSKVGKKVLLSSQSNDAIQNVIERIPDDININAVRFINKSYNKKENNLSIDNVVRNYYYLLDNNISTNIKFDESKLNLFHKKKNNLINKMQEYIKSNENINNQNVNNDSIDTFKNDLIKLISEINYEYQLKLNIESPNLIDDANNSFNLIELEFENLRRRTQYINPLINDIKNFYVQSYENNYNGKEIMYDTKKYHTTVYDNLINVFSMTLTSPDKFKTSDSSMIYSLGIEEVSMKYVDVDVVIIDEASKANLLELFMALMYGKVLILVGDYRQLPPIINTQKDEIKAVNEKYQKKYNYEDIINLLEDSPFKNLITANNSGMLCTLKTQYRSHRDIVEVMNNFYGHQLESDPIVDTTKKHNLIIKGNTKNIINNRSSVYWIDSSLKEKNEIAFECSEENSNSLYNDYEVRLTIKTLLKINDDVKMQKLNYKPSVAIINFYSLQVSKMKKEFSKIIKKIDCIEVEIDTVDAFQGRESDFVIVSLVRNPRTLNSESGREFLKRYERINVAFSRAKKLLIIIGAKRATSGLIVELPNYENPGIINRKEIYDDIYSMLMNKDAIIAPSEILGDENNDIG